MPKFDATRVVDGQRKITFLKPLPPTSAGKKFTVRSKVIGVYDKGKAGTVVETEQLLVDETGEAYSRAVGSGFFVGQGNWGGPKGEGYLALMSTFGCVSWRELMRKLSSRSKHGELSSSGRKETRCSRCCANYTGNSSSLPVSHNISLINRYLV